MLDENTAIVERHLSTAKTLDEEFTDAVEGSQAEREAQTESDRIRTLAAQRLEEGNEANKDDMTSLQAREFEAQASQTDNPLDRGV